MLVSHAERVGHAIGVNGVWGNLGLGPMVAAGLRVDLRRSAEFAEHHHQRVLQQPADLQILDQAC